MVMHTTGGGLEGAWNDMRSHTNQRKLLSVAFANGQNMCTVKQCVREAAQMVCMARSLMHSNGVLPIWSACWDRWDPSTKNRKEKENKNKKPKKIKNNRNCGKKQELWKERQDAGIMWRKEIALTWNLPPLTSLKERIAAPSSARV